MNLTFLFHQENFLFRLFNLKPVYRPSKRTVLIKSFYYHPVGSPVICGKILKFSLSILVSQQDWAPMNRCTKILRLKGCTRTTVFWNVKLSLFSKAFRIEGQHIGRWEKFLDLLCSQFLGFKLLHVHNNYTHDVRTLVDTSQPIVFEYLNRLNHRWFHTV